MKFLLRPLACIYGTVTTARNAAYEKKIFSSYRSPLPVISVGNITAGGSGKTPLTLFLARELRAAGFNPVILSRGYGGSDRGPRIVEPSDNPSLVGDEPLLLAKKGGAPVVIARERSAGARLIESRKLGNLILLDDGLQHRALARDVEIIAIDVSSARALEEFSAKKLLPEGRLREDRDRALARADIVMLNHRAPKESAQRVEAITKFLPEGLPVFQSFVTIASIRESTSGAALSAGTTVVAVCALGNPEGFFSTVAAAGNPVIDRVSARDHHAFSAEELGAIQAKHPKAALVCSEKDAVKLPSDLKFPVYVLAAELAVDDAAAFLEKIIARVRA